MSRRPILYVAYPMRLDLRAANAIQTYNTVRELQAILPGTLLVIPRWLREKSAFSALDTLHLPRPAINKLSRLLPWAGWSYIERSLYSFILVVLLLSRRLMRRPYRALYVRDTVCAAWLCLLRPLHGSPVIYEVHDLEASHPSNAPRWPAGLWAIFLPWLDRRSILGARKVVSLTHSFKRSLVAAGVRSDQDVAVIPDGFDPSIFYPVHTLKARRALGLPPDPFIIGYAGLTFAYRGLELLLSASASLMREDASLLLLLAGGGPREVARLRSLGARLGIDCERMITPGQVSRRETALFLNASDLLVIPDTVTGLTASPLKLFEYLAVGKAVVCKDMPALREVVDDGCAAFFTGGDAAALASVIMRLRGDGARRMQMGEAALRRAVGYSYRARAEKIAEVARCSP
ncbi:MAG: glycosyltransferase [Chloroflexi bacterium]|nr:glycosyltransferase [Chloroflexota bacterium]